MKKNAAFILALVLMLAILCNGTVFANPIVSSMDYAINNFESQLEEFKLQTLNTCIPNESKTASNTVKEVYLKMPSQPITVNKYNAVSDGIYSSLQIENGIAKIYSDECSISFATPNISQLQLGMDNTAHLISTEPIKISYKPVTTGAYEYIVFENKESINNINRNIVLKEDLHLESAYDKLLETPDGSLLIKNSTNKTIGAISAPIAFDAAGVPVAVTTVLNGSNIDYSFENNEDYVSYPVVARIAYNAGTTFYSYYSSGGWKENYHPIYGRSLSLWPLEWRFSWLSAAEKEVRWVAVYNYYYLDSQWHNTAGLKDQFLCHLNLGILEEEWNLEPNRPNIPATAFNRCNPE